MKVVSKFALIIATALFATNLSATPIEFYQLPDSDYDPVPGLVYTMLDIENTAPGPVNSVGLTDGSGRTVGVSDPSGDGMPSVYDGSAVGWWPDNRKFIGTDRHQIVLDFASDEFFVQAITFDLVASFGNPRIWIETILDNGTVTRSEYFRPGSATGEVNSYGLALGADAAKSCRVISRVIIDPDPAWGITDAKIGESGRCAQVPEPGSLSLLGAGLLGLGLLQRARRRSKPEAQGLV